MGCVNSSPEFEKIEDSDFPSIQTTFDTREYAMEKRNDMPPSDNSLDCGEEIWGNGELLNNCPSKGLPRNRVTRFQFWFCWSPSGCIRISFASITHRSMVNSSLAAGNKASMGANGLVGLMFCIASMSLLISDMAPAGRDGSKETPTPTPRHIASCKNDRRGLLYSSNTLLSSRRILFDFRIDNRIQMTRDIFIQKHMVMESIENFVSCRWSEILQL